MHYEAYAGGVASPSKSRSRIRSRKQIFMKSFGFPLSKGVWEGETRSKQTSQVR